MYLGKLWKVENMNKKSKNFVSQVLKEETSSSLVMTHNMSTFVVFGIGLDNTPLVLKGDE